MTSLVADLLEPRGELVKENITYKVDDLKRKLEDIQLEVQESLKSRYVEFYPQYIKLDRMISDLSSINGEFDVLHNQIENEIKPHLTTSILEFNDVVEDLSRIKKLKATAFNLCLLHRCLENTKSSTTSYLKAAENLIDFDATFKTMDTENSTNIDIIAALRMEFITKREDLIYRLQNIWRENISISGSLEGKKKTLTLKFNPVLNNEDGIELLQSLTYLKQLESVMKEFGNKFLTSVCEIVLKNLVKLQVSEDSQAMVIYIIQAHPPEPSKVFGIFTQILTFMNNSFFHLPISFKNEDNELCAMDIFGKVISKDFCDLLIEKCLKDAIPKQSRQLEMFHNEIENANNFCNDLQQLRFLAPSENGLLNFIQDVDILPVNKISQNFLSRARSLIKQNLHQTITVGQAPDHTLLEESVLHDLNSISAPKNSLSKSTFDFPQCQISESIQQLVRLLIEINEEAKNINTAHSLKLYYIARNVCDLYCSIVPTYHKDSIEKIPQQTAIFHNNCMYLAHQLCTLGTHFESHLQPNIPTTFIDFVPEIRKLGTEAFLGQMRQQRQQMVQMLKEQQVYGSIMINDEAVSKAEKGIRQCLCQLQSLKKIWSEVLPEEVYFKAIGTLFNTCVEEIIAHILFMEDIAAEAAGQLDSVFTIFLKQGPELFKTPSVDRRDFVHQYVRKWFKFQELQLVLGASMREIVDRWASGKGPLATHFSAEEVKHLIRALFQNTERRAAALAKIR